MEIEDTTSTKEKPESYNDTEVEERLKDIDDDSFIAYFEKFNLRPGNDENCAARKIDAENGRIVEQNEIGGEQYSANWHLDRLYDPSPLEVQNTLGDIATESEEDLPETEAD